MSYNSGDAGAADQGADLDQGSGQDQGQDELQGQGGGQEGDEGQDQEQDSAQVGAEGQQQNGQQRQRFVPHEALHRERLVARQEREARQIAERNFQQIQAILLRQMEGNQGGGKQQQEPEIPDINTDPVGHFRAKAEAMERRLAQVEQPVRQQSENQQFMATYRAKAQEFAGQTPDFQAAYAFALPIFERLGKHYGGTAADAERELVARALRTGVNPGKAIYDLAVDYGYKTGAGGQGGGQQQGQGGAQAGLEAVERGMATARGRGGEPSNGSGELTMESLARLPYSEWAKIPTEKLDRIMGKAAR